MSRVYAFAADGLEEVECLAVVDMLRRCGVETVIVSVTGEKLIKGSHGIAFEADKLFEEIDPADADALFLPGGMPGTKHLAAHEGLKEALLAAKERGQHLAAICAAPSVLGELGLLEGLHATCYPGFEPSLKGAIHTGEGVVTDRGVTTGRGVGYAIDMGLELAAVLVGEAVSEDTRESIQYNWQ